MGQVLEEVGHSPTLVVDEEKGHIVWVEVDSQTQDIGLDGFRLPGSGCPGNQPVRSVSFFMQVEVDQVSHFIFFEGIAEQGNEPQKYRVFKVLKGKCPCSIIPYER